MYGTVIRKQIERTNRNLLVSNVTLLALIFGYAVATTVITGHNQFFLTPGNMSSAPAAEIPQDVSLPTDMSHPTALSVKDLADASRMSSLKDKAVKLTDSNVVDIVFPVWNWSQRAGGHPPSPPPNYRVSKVGDSLFVILPPDTTTWPAYTGVLRPLAKDDENTVSTVLKSRGVQQVSLMPYMLDCLSVGGRTGAAGAVGSANRPVAYRPPNVPLPNMFYLLLGAVPVWNIVKALQRKKNPLTHPTVKSLEKYGQPEEVARAIDAEALRGVTKITPAQFTASWLLVPTFFTFIVVHLDHVVWVYERVYITRGRTFAVCVRDRQGSYYEFTCAMFQVHKIIEYLTKMRPWIVSGYSGQTNVEYVSNRAQFIAQSDAARQRYLAMQSGTPPVV